jgi:DNA-binding transcriptional LysR family regulator
LAKRKRLRLEALAEESFLMVPRHLGPGFYDQVIGLCARAGFTPRVVQEARTTPTIVSLIAGGMGVSIVPASMQSLRRDGIIYRPVEPAAAADLAVMWRPHDASPVLRAFLEVVWEVAGFKRPPRQTGSAS